MEKEKKKISCSYAVLVIILFAALAFVTDYAIIERKMNKCNCPKCEITTNNGDKEDNIVVDENSSEQVNRSDSDMSAYIRTTNIKVQVADRNTYADVSVVDGKLEVKYQSNTETYEINGEKVKSIHLDYYQSADNNVIFVLTEKGNMYINTFYVGESSEINILNNFVKMDYTNVKELIKVYNDEYAIEDSTSGIANMKKFYIYALTNNGLIKIDNQYSI